MRERERERERERKRVREREERETEREREAKLLFVFQVIKIFSYTNSPNFHRKPLQSVKFKEPCTFSPCFVVLVNYLRLDIQPHWKSMIGSFCIFTASEKTHGFH